jgi:hypothetical protein
MKVAEERDIFHVCLIDGDIDSDGNAGLLLDDGSPIVNNRKRSRGRGMSEDRMKMILFLELAIGSCDYGHEIRSIVIDTANVYIAVVK